MRTRLVKASNKIKSLTLHITFTLNNVIFNLTNAKGNSLFLISTGFLLVQTTKKTMYFSAKLCLERMIRKIRVFKPKHLFINFSGSNRGRRSLTRLFKKYKLSITAFGDITRKPFNGCRPKKQRRI